MDGTNSKKRILYQKDLPKFDEKDEDALAEFIKRERNAAL